MVGKVLHGERGVGVALLTHFLWEKASSKQDCLDFLLALNNAAPHPVLCQNFSNSSTQQQKWLSEAFTKDQMMCESTLQAAALTLLDADASDETWSSSYEQVAAGLSAEQAFRPPLRLNQFSYRKGKAVPDCVELAVREILELILYQPDRCAFDTSLLPTTAHPALLSFFRATDKQAEADSDKLQSELAFKWFNLCQNLGTGGHFEGEKTADDQVCSPAAQFSVWFLPAWSALCYE